MASNDYGEIASLMGTMLTLTVVIVLAWVLLRWLAKRTPMQGGSRYIKLLDKVAVSPDKCLLLVKVADQTMLVAMTSHAVEKLCDVETLEEIPPSAVPTFRSLFTQRMQTKGEEE